VIYDQVALLNERGVRLTLSEIFDKSRKICEDPDFSAAIKWKEEQPGRKVVGCFPVYTPVEIIHAAGLLPLGVLGAGNLIEIDQSDSLIQSFICSVIRSTTELGLTGRLDFLDAIYFTSICDAARNLSGVWKMKFPNQLVEYIHFPQNMTSEYVVDYYRSELDRLKSNLEKLTGRKVHEDQLRESIALFNRCRSLMEEIYSIKREKPWLITSEEAYAVMRASTSLPVEESNAMLQEVLDALPGRGASPRDGIRIIIEGAFCEQPPLEMIKAIEEAGAFIVDDDFLVGWRWFEGDVPLDGDPLTNLSDSYINRSVYSSVRHYGEKPRDRELVDKFRRSGAEGVIFCPAKFCEPALFDYVLYKETMEKEGTPYLAMEFEEKMEVFEGIRSQVETFAESLLFFAS
jgi:benzoyl-CoA reductase subunit C